jgi:hypothetical protein
VWRGPDGIRVEVIVLDRRPRLRATQTLNGHRYLLGYYRDPQELTQHCDLADLVEVIDLPTHGVPQ